MISTILRLPGGKAKHHTGDVGLTVTGAMGQDGLGMEVTVELCLLPDTVKPLLCTMLEIVEKHLGREVVESSIAEWQEIKVKNEIN